MSEVQHAPGYPGLGPRFGWILGVWYLQEGEERVAIVEEEGDHGRWWLLYHWVGNVWVNMGEFVSAVCMAVWTAPLFAEVVDVAIPVDPLQTVQLVVEEGYGFLWWVVYGTSWVLLGPILAFAAPRWAFVVPI
jgi:hypothetical protein